MNIGFHSCTLPNWCCQHGTNEQYTGCIRVSQDGRTCYSPTIRYGTTYGGRSMNHPDDITSWCQQLFPTIIVTRRFFYMKTIKIKVIQNFMEITFYIKTYSKRTCWKKFFKFKF